MFDQIFGIHERALYAAADRVGVLATNIANADTPNYKARDLDFAAVLSGTSEAGGLPLVRTSAAHLPLAGAGEAGADLKYRIPYQPSLDGNTVEAPVEQAKFAENAMRYQTSLDFINRRISSLMTALTGQ
ncbi:MAG: flagellar basal body rod protein FlgB [Proteobacteria bacterium]|nr:flagellar basal body rod protein FlgB [Pseudomonadota bacterium]